MVKYAGVLQCYYRTYNNNTPPNFQQDSKIKYIREYKTTYEVNIIYCRLDDM